MSLLISKKGIYTSSETWNAIRSKLPKANWWNLIWFPIAIPRHAFILWLDVKDSLSTGERLLKWSFKGDVMCVFCRSNIKGRDHLFFQYGFSERIWRGS
jgi:hypothetical protein